MTETATAPATIRYRYEIGDPHSFDLCEASQTQAGAFARAAEIAKRRDHCITVYDRMAKRGEGWEWAVQPSGHTHITRVKPVQR